MNPVAALAALDDCARRLAAIQVELDRLRAMEAQQLADFRRESQAFQDAAAEALARYLAA